MAKALIHCGSIHGVYEPKVLIHPRVLGLIHRRIVSWNT